MKLSSKSLFVLVALAASSIASQAHADCSINQLMREVRLDTGDSNYTYYSDRSGSTTTPPAPYEHPGTGKDTYVFWVANGADTYEALVVFDTGECSGGQTRFIGQ